MKKRRTIGLCVLTAILIQIFAMIPAEALADTPGETLTVRVQYAGEREEKIREKARYSNSELEAMGAQTLRYSNVTNVGTVLAIVAYGPKLTAVLDRAGIDLGSIQYITFRTTDGEGEHQRYSRNFYVGQHLTAARYFYPNLQKNYERHDDDTLTPLPGALGGRQSVPSILALKSFSTKDPGRTPEPSDMKTDEAYRFCLGQPPTLKENVKTRGGYDGGDVTAMESAQLIFGIDVTLYGSPVDGISLNLDDKNLKVGSKAKISAVISGDELFADDYGFGTDDLEWSSSDEEIAEVDQNGMITVKKEGTVTITAKAPNGMTASVTINAAENDGSDSGREEKKQNESQKDDERDGDRAAAAAGLGKDKKDKGGKSKKKAEKSVRITVKEVKIGGKIEEEGGEQAAARKQMANDAQALDKAEETNPYIVFAAGYTALLVLAFGAVFRIRRYFKEV